MTESRRQDVITCVFIGGGGHASALLDCLEHEDHVVIAGLLTAEPADVGTLFHALPVLGGDDMLASLPARGITHFVVAVGGISDNEPRRVLFDRAVTAGLLPLTVVDPRSIVSPSATLGPGCQVFPGAIVGAGARLGANVIVNSGAIVEHDCRVGDHVHVATGAVLASTVVVGTGAHIGAGATVIQTKHVGEWAVVGAGAAVVTDVEAGAVFVGVPAKAIERGAGGPGSA